MGSGYQVGSEDISCGTTLIGMEYDGGVVVGTDSRTSSGNFIYSRITNKITAINDHLCVLRSGNAADTEAVTDIVKYYLEAYSYFEEEAIGVQRAANIFRNFFYKYRDMLQGSVIVAGYDENDGGQLYTIPLGGFISRQRCTGSGSGSTFIHSLLDSNWKPGMKEEDCIELIKQATALAIHRDGSSGGVIRLAIIDKNGTRKIVSFSLILDFYISLSKFFCVFDF
ncbi:unnamed protein product [Dracunculus medinensis]|uniref:Proteasome subunit beta n=1 Tax=Dracunculus medinensis TaxID=318479 RepID=A0A0N4U3N9_DRAME|nr:unnamed protein product [Dracunculus medinensis]